MSVFNSVFDLEEFENLEENIRNKCLKHIALLNKHERPARQRHSCTGADEKARQPQTSSRLELCFRLSFVNLPLPFQNKQGRTMYFLVVITEHFIVSSLKEEVEMWAYTGKQYSLLCRRRHSSGWVHDDTGGS